MIGLDSNYWTTIQAGYLLQGAVITLEVSAAALAGSMVAGLLLAIIRMSSLPPVRWFAGFYVWFMRGTPLLLQLVFLYDVLPAVGINLNAVITAIIGFGANETAFVGEIIRGGLISVHHTQRLAADSLGMGSATKLRRVILPQAMRAILPSLGNESISLLKATSLGSVIALDELTLRGEQVVSTNFQFFQVFIFVGLLYLVMTTALAAIQRYLERHFSLDTRGSGAQGRTPLLRRWLGVDLTRPMLRRGVAAEQIASHDVPSAGGSSPGLTGLEQRVGTPATIGPGRAGFSAHDNPTGGREAKERSGAMASARAFVECRNVCKSFHSGQSVLRGINLEVREGEVLVLMGPSGSGKSTLLRLISHLDVLDDGEILVDGRHVGYRSVDGSMRPVRKIAQARAAARIGMVFQHFNLFEHMTALENIMAAPLYVHHVPRKVAEERAHKELAAVGLADKWNRLPKELSGGQQQRVAIARALALEPRLLLFDEPTSALDPELAGGVLLAIRDLALQGLTMIVVTHEVRFAKDVAERVAFMDDGRVVEEGETSAVLDNPQEPRTRQFLQLVLREEYVANNQEAG